jgi:hypothetical protein
MSSARESIPEGCLLACDTYMECRQIIQMKASVKNYMMTLLVTLPYGSMDSVFNLYENTFYPLYDQDTDPQRAIPLCCPFNVRRLLLTAGVIRHGINRENRTEVYNNFQQKICTE